MMASSNSLFTATDIANAWGLPNRSFEITKFLENAGVSPVKELKYARGVMRLYESDCVSMKQQFIEEKQTNKMAQKIRFAAQAKEMAKRAKARQYAKSQSGILEKLNDIESKVDYLVALWQGSK